MRLVWRQSDRQYEGTAPAWYWGLVYYDILTFERVLAVIPLNWFWAVGREVYFRLRVGLARCSYLEKSLRPYREAIEAEGYQRGKRVGYADGWAARGVADNEALEKAWELTFGAKR